MNSDIDIPFLQDVIVGLDDTLKLSNPRVFISKAGLICTITSIIDKRYISTDNYFSDWIDELKVRDSYIGMGVRITKNRKETSYPNNKDPMFVNLMLGHRTMVSKINPARTLIDTRPFFNVFNNTTEEDIVRNVRLFKCAQLESGTIADILSISKSKVRRILKEVYGRNSS